MHSPTRAVIELDIPGATISRHLYGHFAEHLGRCIYDGFWVGDDSDIPNTGGIRTDIVDALRELRIPNLRWPGGCFADEYHWRDGVGPREQRPRMVNSHWGDVVENNHFGTHEFMALCELLGAAPYVNGNVGSGTVQEMSEWVEYLTRGDDSPMAALRRSNGRDEPWKVPFWGIGNEPWGCGGNMRAEAYADLARQYSTYLRNHADNRLYRIAAGADAEAYFWTKALMETAKGPSGGHPFEAISLHYYTVPGGNWRGRGTATGFDADGYYSTMVRAARVEEVISRHSAIMDVEDPERNIGLVLDEWGTWWDVEPGTNPGFLYQQNTMRDALVATVHFDAFHRHADRLAMANIAQTVNVLQSVVLTDPQTNQLILTPTYHAFAMNVGHHDAQALPTHLSGVPVHDVDGVELSTVSASASTKDDKALVSVTNLAAEDSATVILDLRGRTVTDVRGRILTSDELNAHNTATAPEAVTVRDFHVARTQDAFGHGLQLDMPPHSYVTVELDLV